jgi:hypothetical protein
MYKQMRDKNKKGKNLSTLRRRRRRRRGLAVE